MSEILKELNNEEQKIVNTSKKIKTCILCEETQAKFCVKDMPHMCYCEDCAQEEFGSLDYLERLE